MAGSGREAAPAGPARVTILTGFLGSGKTTLLNRLLRDPAASDTAVIVNEFGEVGIDHLLVETARGGILELSNGCLCCTMRGDLVDTLLGLAERSGPPLRRVIVETTGLADPTPILAALMGHPLLLDGYALDGVVTTVDALSGGQSLDAREEARRQVAVADRLVLTKTDLADPGALPELRRRLALINPRAALLDTAKGEATAAGLLDCGLGVSFQDPWRWIEPSACGPSGEAGAHRHGHPDAGEAHAHPHLGDVISFALVHEVPIRMAAIEGFLDILHHTQGQNLLRMKAVVQTAEDPGRPLVLHGVRSFLHPPARLPAWPAGTEPQTRLVLIGEKLRESYVRDLFAAFTGEPRVDRPDAAALEDNPLAIAGMSF